MTSLEGFTEALFGPLVRDPKARLTSTNATPWLSASGCGYACLRSRLVTFGHAAGRGRVVRGSLERGELHGEDHKPD